MAMPRLLTMGFHDNHVFPAAQPLRQQVVPGLHVITSSACLGNQVTDIERHAAYQSRIPA